MPDPASAFSVRHQTVSFLSVASAFSDYCHVHSDRQVNDQVADVVASPHKSQASQS